MYLHTGMACVKARPRSAVHRLSGLRWSALLADRKSPDGTAGDPRQLEG